jgi:hypothetical protein
MYSETSSGGFTTTPFDGELGTPGAGDEDAALLSDPTVAPFPAPSPTACVDSAPSTWTASWGPASFFFGLSNHAIASHPWKPIYA